MALAARRIDERMDLGTRIDVLESAMMELLDIQIMKPFAGQVASLATRGMSASSVRCNP